jgi:hypothetical protein
MREKKEESTKGEQPPLGRGREATPLPGAHLALEKIRRVAALLRSAALLVLHDLRKATVRGACSPNTLTARASRCWRT